MRLTILFTSFALLSSVAQAANPVITTETQPLQTDAAEMPVLDKTPGDFLSKEPFPSASMPGFYNEIPPNIEPAVRMAAEDNYASSTALLQEELKKTTDPKEKARILMWLGITQAHQALDYEAAAGWYGVATTSTQNLRQAIKLDPEVYKAVDVARCLAAMVGQGWAQETPEAEVDRAEKKSKALAAAAPGTTDSTGAKIEQKDAKELAAIEAYYAGVTLQQVVQRSWEYSDTKTDDERILGFFARSIVLAPDRYETWPHYLNAAARLKMYDLLTSDGEKMIQRFNPLRTPSFADQGPAALYLKTRGPIPRELAEQYCQRLIQEKPDDPYAHFTLAQILMGAEQDDQTSPVKSIKAFEDFLENVKSGKIKLLPREQGYRVSALYKLGFLYRQIGQLEKSLQTYQRIKELSPKYAETDYNIAETYLRLAESETTGPKMVEYLEKGREHAKLQSENDYKNQASLKSDELRRRLAGLARKARAVVFPKSSTSSKEEQTTQSSSK